MVAFGKSQGGGRRSAPRASTPMLATVSTLTRSHSAVVVNVSTSGARLRGSDLPSMSEDLVVNIETVQAFGTVIWSEQGEAGIEFDPPLNLDEEALLRRRMALTQGLPLATRFAFENWVEGCGR
jgi:hypothetical protein